MKSVLEFLGNVVNNVLSVDAGPLAARHAQAAFRGPHIGARAPEIHFELMGQFVEKRLELVGRGAEQNYVTR